MKHISRIDSSKKNTHGWYVRIWFQGKMLSRFFSDKKAGDKDISLDQALAWRDEMRRELGLPLTDRVVVTRNPRNKSGVIGIQISTKRDRSRRDPDKEGKPRSYYVVTYPTSDNGVGRKLYRVPTTKEARKAALRRAAKFLRDREREVYGQIVAARWRQALAALESSEV